MTDYTKNSFDYNYAEYETLIDYDDEIFPREGSTNETIIMVTNDGNASTYLTQRGYYCHEKLDQIQSILDKVSFWIEGVALTTVAIIGLLGNLLTVIVLPRLDRGPPNISRGGNGGTSFNTFDIFGDF